MPRPRVIVVTSIGDRLVFELPIGHFETFQSIVRAFLNQDKHMMFDTVCLNKQHIVSLEYTDA